MKISLQFHSDAVAADTLFISELHGSEALSQTFQFELELTSKKTDVDFNAMLEKDAWVGIEQGVQLKVGGNRGSKLLKIHGVLSSFVQGEQHGDWVRYQAILVPRLWRLQLNTRSQVFQDMTVPEIVEAVLTDSANGAGMSSSDFEMKVKRSYSKREFVVQYQETDFNFISRLLEHEGIFYFFDHKDAASKVIFGDDPSAHQPITGDPTVPYHPVGQGESSTGDQEAIQHFTGQQSAITGNVTLKDYNYRKPSQDIKVDSAVADKAAFGTLYSYGEHYKDAGEGKALAKLRAELIKSHQLTFSGQSNSRSLRSGLTFTLTGHYRKDFNGDYLFTHVRHSASQSLASGSAGGEHYENHFTCIPSKVPFRPLLMATKPRVHGDMHAVIDASGSKQYAELDDEGRYKVILPYDLSGRKDGKASRLVRMAQPYGGDNMGMHFPLHKGTEVILTHIDGDPDRPIIAGSVPNPETASMVKAANQTQCVLKSGGNNELRFEDTEGSEQVYLHAQKDRETKIENDEAKKVGANQKLEVAGNQGNTIKGDQSTSVGGNQSNTIDGNQSTNVGGDRTETIVGNHTETVSKNQTVTIAIAATETIGAAKALTIGAAYQVTVGAAMNETVGAAKTEQVGGVSKELVGADKSLSAGGDITVTAGGSHNQTAAKEHVTKAKTITLEATDEITIKVGDALINMKKDGTITIDGKDVTAKASGKFTAKADSDVTIKGSKIVQN